MRDYDIAVENLQMRTRGLAELDICDIVINNVSPEHYSVGAELLTRLAKQQLAEGAIVDGASLPAGYWEIVLQKQRNGLYEVLEWNPDRTQQVPGITSTATYELDQKSFCKAAGLSFSPPSATQMIAVSSGVLEREMPLEGIRYPAPPHMSGWYITTPKYDGNVDSMRVDHAYHLTAQRPELAKLLALPPGSWFVLHETHEEVGFDIAVASQEP